jgi:hypothetical protein
MINLSANELTVAEGDAARRCARCSEQLRLVGTILDSRKGRTIRMFRCQCGEQTWISDPA